MARTDIGEGTDVDGSERTGRSTASAASGVSRRQAIRAGCLVTMGGLLTGVGTDGVSASSDDGDGQPREVHLDYDEYDSWDDVYRMTSGERDAIDFVSSPTSSGETALQVRVDEHDHWGVSTHYDFEGGLLELNGRVRFALDTGWSMDGRDLANCRLWNCAISLGEGSAGGGVPDGTNGWSNRLYVTSKDTNPEGPYHLLSNTYHVRDTDDGVGDHDYLVGGEEYVVSVPEIDRGEWYEFEYEVCVNTVDEGSANDDGIVRYWLDGDLVYERENFTFTEDLENNVIDTNGPVGHYGGRYTAPRTLYAYYDDHSMVLDGSFDEVSTDAADPRWCDLLSDIFGD